MAQRGRPKAATEAKREARLAFRLTAAQRAEIEARAAAAGLPVADYARALLLPAEAAATIRRRTPTAARLTPDEFRELNRVGVNLNQIARALNYGTGNPVADDLGEALAALSTIFDRFLK